MRSSEELLQERLLAILKLLAYEQRPCKHCEPMLDFVQLPEGTSILGAYRVKDHWMVAYNGEGENHASHCPSSAQNRLPEQQSL